MIRLRKSRYDRRPERSRSVHCCTGIKYCETDTGHYLRLDSTSGNGLQVARKQCQTNSNLFFKSAGKSTIGNSSTKTYRSEWGNLVLFCGQHKDGYDEGCRDEHFDENALCTIRTLLQEGTDGTHVCTFSGCKLRTVGLTYFTDNGAEVKDQTMADAAIAPANCAMQYKTKRTGPMLPTKRSASETLGLNRPPVTRKNNQADTSRLMPMLVAI